MRDIAETAEAMTSADYKERFVAEYLQTKIRYGKLKDMLNRYDATKAVKEEEKFDIDYLGFVPTCPISLLREQQHIMGELLHIYEVRAVIEGIDLTKYE